VTVSIYLQLLGGQNRYGLMWAVDDQSSWNAN